MTEFTFVKADKKQRPARIFLSGPSGSGKSWTAMTWMTVLAGDQQWGVIDTEGGSALDYSNDFEFHHLEFKPPFSTERYIAAINAAADAGLAGLVIDSLSHAWAGKGGLLEQVDNHGRANRGDTFGAWRDATPKHNQLIDALMGFPGHLICCVRSKTDYQMQQNDRGKWQPVKLGLAPVQRDGLDYEFQIVGEMAIPNNVLTITKTRCPALVDLVVEKPTGEIAATMAKWLGDGSPIEREARPTVDEIFRAAGDSTDFTEIGDLYRRAGRFQLLVSPVPDPNSDEEILLGDYLIRRGEWAKKNGTAPATSEDTGDAA